LQPEFADRPYSPTFMCSYVQQCAARRRRQLAMRAMLILITYVPAISLALPRALGMM